MGRKIKLIWDFMGPDSKITAEHHEHHLIEFNEAQKLEKHDTGTEVLSDLHAISFMIVEQDEMIPVRDALRPNRGEWYDLA